MVVKCLYKVWLLTGKLQYTTIFNVNSGNYLGNA
jgi:hypothetical protein